MTRNNQPNTNEERISLRTLRYCSVANTLVLFLMHFLFALSLSACASEISKDISSNSFEGTWEPESENYWGLGDLVIENDTLTWGNCLNVSYSVLKVEPGTYYLELARNQVCRLRGDASFLILEPKPSKVEVSICKDKSELGKERKDRLCSLGVLRRK